MFWDNDKIKFEHKKVKVKAYETLMKCGVGGCISEFEQSIEEVDRIP